MQAPTLLNRLRCRKWSLEVADFGDAENLAEAEQCELDQWDGRPDGVTHAIVCTPDQLARARRNLPDAKVLWAMHCAKSELLPPLFGVDGVLAFSHRVAFMQAGARGYRDERPIHVVVPWYELGPRWRHDADRAWALLNRPETRPRERTDSVLRLGRQSGVTTLFYGQGTKRGYLGAQEREELVRCSTAYVSPLPPYAGFGLSQHECFAAGVPVVATRWGDMPLEMPDEYGLSDDFPKLVERLRRLNVDPSEAERTSQVGLEFIRDKRRLRRTELDVERLLDTSR